MLLRLRADSGYGLAKNGFDPEPQGRLVKT